MRDGSADEEKSSQPYFLQNEQFGSSPLEWLEVIKILCSLVQKVYTLVLRMMNSDLWSNRIRRDPQIKILSFSAITNFPSV